MFILIKTDQLNEGDSFDWYNKNLEFNNIIITDHPIVTYEFRKNELIGIENIDLFKVYELKEYIKEVLNE